MTTQEKICKMNKAFENLTEEGKQYVLAVVNALEYATTIPSKSKSPKKRKKTKSKPA